MSQQTWVETLLTSQVDGTAYTFNAGAAGTILPAAARLTLPSNYFYIGKAIRVKASGRVSNIVTTPGTLTIDVMLGPSGTIKVFTGGAMPLNIVAKTNVTWYMDIILTCRAIGGPAATSLMGIGNWASESAVGTAAGACGAISMPASSPIVSGTLFDNTVANVLDLFATWSLTGNSILVHQYSVEAMN